jgi:hypothetical protein
MFATVGNAVIVGLARVEWTHPQEDLRLPGQRTEQLGQLLLNV